MKESTKTAYESKLNSMLTAAGVNREDLAGRFSLAPSEIQKFFREAMIGKCKSSYSIYRQAMYYFLDGLGVDRSRYDITGFDSTATRRGVSKKKKSYPESLRLEVLRRLQKQKNMTDIDRFIFLHLQLGPYTGNRLIEYLSMQIVESNELMVTLKIQNGKRNDVRANGEYRSFSIAGEVCCPLSGKRLSIVDLINEMSELLRSTVGLIEDSDLESTVQDKKSRMLQLIRGADNKHKRVIDGMAGLRGLRPMLSSTRHQFKIGISKCVDEVGVAASMGHASVDTHARNYGLERGGSKLTFDEKATYKLIKPSEASRVLVTKRESINPAHRVR